MIYAVIDTNILVSAMLTHNPQAATARVLDYIVEGVITPVYNDDIISEYQEVLNRPKFCFDPLLVKYVLDYFGIMAYRCSQLHTKAVCRMKKTAHSMKFHWAYQIRSWSLAI